MMFGQSSHFTVPANDRVHPAAANDVDFRKRTRPLLGSNTLLAITFDPFQIVRMP